MEDARSMQTLIANSIFAIVVGIPNALVLVMLINAWTLRGHDQQNTEEARAKLARNCIIFVVVASAFYFGLSLGEGHPDPAVIQLSLEGLLGAILPLVAWRWFARRARKFSPGQFSSS